MTWRFPNQDLDLPEEDQRLDHDELLKRFVTVSRQVEENFKAAQASPQFTAGAVWQAVPQARVYNSASISIANGTTTALTFDSERWDTGATSEQHSTSSNTGRLTCQRAGLYQVGVALNFDASGTGSRVVALRLNGATTIAEDGKPALAGGYGTAFAVVTDYRLAVGDYMDVVVLQNSGGSLNVLAEGNKSPEFYWHWVSP